MSIHMLKLGHRPVRDKRMTTHLMLAARAFGASGALYTGVRAPSVEEKVMKVCSEWGGAFSVEYVEDWLGTIKTWKQRGRVIHLTMYGLPLQRVIPLIREDPLDKLMIVGGAKVPGVVYDLADWNVAVTSQPHSEVSALAVFLHVFFEGREFEKVFEGARLRVVPQERGKRVEKASQAV
jgi:tRNA (cytidine56-2'-O)-methyltransferase